MNYVVRLLSFDHDLNTGKITGRSKVNVPAFNYEHALALAKALNSTGSSNIKTRTEICALIYLEGMVGNVLVPVDRLREVSNDLCHAFEEYDKAAQQADSIKPAKKADLKLSEKFRAAEAEKSYAAALVATDHPF